MKLKAEASLSQRQTLSQSQSQSLEILAMPNIELEDFVRREQEENPFLEMPEQGWTYERTAQASVWGEDDGSYDALRNVAAPQGVSLAEYLLSQLDEHTTPPNEFRILRYIIESLDDSGFLSVSIKELSMLLHEPVALVQTCAERVRTLEPAGVGADCLAQCLELQLAREGALDSAFQQLVRYHLEDVAASRYQDAARAIGVSRERLLEYVERLRGLCPRPAAAFGACGTQFVVPDVICKWEDDTWNVRISEGWVGCVGLSRLYEGLMKAANEPEVQAYFTERIARAKFVLQSIAKRRETLLGIAQQTAERQTAYLLGRGPLVPYTMRQLAETLGVHESTVGRGVHDKYMQTPRGTVPLRALFTAALGADEDVSRDGVQQALRALIEAEDAAHPLSDQALCERLCAQGLTISRRTVAKYRELLGIPSTTGRKRKTPLRRAP